METKQLKNPLIKKFLINFKILISEGKLNIIQRRYDYASKIEMNIDSIKEVLMSLKTNDYVKGPDEDRDRCGEYLWVFKKDDESIEPIYIKLKIIDDEARVISFHFDR